MSRTRDGSDRAVGQSQLDRLRQHEEKLAARLEEAQAQATRLLEDERARTDAARRAVAEEIRSETERIRREMRAAAIERSEAVLAEAATEARRLAGVADSRVSELADGVFRRLFAGEGLP